MVRCHKSTGTPRHYRKNQQKHDCRVDHCIGRCKTCIYHGRAAGDRRLEGKSVFSACFNKKSKMYMRIVNLFCDSCSCYKIAEE